MRKLHPKIINPCTKVLMDDEADGFCIDNCFSYGNVNLLLNLLAPIIYASVLYLSIFISREKENPTI